MIAVCLVVQHVAPERPFTIESALRALGVRIDVRRVYAGDPIPDHASGLDGLVVMGGPMSAHRDEGFPTRMAEVYLHDARNDFSLAWMSEKTFAAF